MLTPPSSKRKKNHALFQKGGDMSNLYSKVLMEGMPCPLIPLTLR